MVIYDIPSQPGFIYHFTKKTQHKETVYWKCFACNAQNRSQTPTRPIPVIKVRQNRLLDDPEDTKNPHFCTPIAKTSAAATQIDREGATAQWREPPKPRSRQALENDRKLRDEKFDFLYWWTATEFASLSAPQVQEAILSYLSRCGYLVGG
jgi:hypothetical protein